MKRNKVIKLLALIISLIFLFIEKDIYVSAYSAPEILLDFSENENIEFYLKLDKGTDKPQQVLVDGEKAYIDDFSEFDKNDVVRTVFLIDKTALDSQYTNNLFMQTLKKIISSANKNESFAVMSFGEEYFSVDQEFTENQMNILDTAENIEYIFGMSDLYSGIKSVSENIADENFLSFDRIIVFTNSDTINFAHLSEITDQISSQPVFFIISEEEEHMIFEDNLKGKGFYSEYCRVSDEDDSIAVATVIQNFTDIYKMKIKPGENALRTGGIKHIQMLFDTNGITATAEMSVDIGNYYRSFSEDDNKTAKITAVLSLIAAAIMAAILVYVLRKQKSEKKNESEIKSIAPVNCTVPLKAKKGQIGTIISTISTRVLFRDNSVFTVILTEIGNELNKIEISTDKEAIIGRNQSMADFVIYNERSVSQKHCRIYSRNSKIYVSDLGSLNHTFVDGEEVKEETELFSGSVLKIGRAVFDVRIVPN